MKTATKADDLEMVYIPLTGIKPDPNNARTHDDDQVMQIANSIHANRFYNPIILDDQGVIIAGHGRYLAAKKLKLKTVPCIVMEGLTDEEKAAINVTDNQLALNAAWDKKKLAATVKRLAAANYDMDLLGFQPIDLDELMKKATEALDGAGGESEKPDHGPVKRTGILAEKFGVPPLSVLNTREGWWQDRKRAWLTLGIQSEQGRPDVMEGLNSLTEKFGNRGSSAIQSSKFDPVLCELVYRWFCPQGGKILDPFAGGTAGGTVAAVLEREFIGVELRAEQVEANQNQWADIAGSIRANYPNQQIFEPQWINGDSRDIADLCKGKTFDFIFSSPPYGDLEQYSDDPADLSNAPDYEDFKDSYRDIIYQVCKKLKANRFACFAVGDFRDKKGFYQGFISDTIRAFQDAGLQLYNEAILVNAIGSLAVRCGRWFTGSRKLGKTHQNILVFVKGDPVKATQACGDVEFGDILDGSKDEAQDDAGNQD